MKNKHILLIALLVLVIAIVIIIFHNLNSNNSKNELINYEENLLGINFQKYVLDSSGDINKNSENEDYAKIKFKINPELLNEFKIEVNNNMNLLDNNTWNQMNGTNLANEVNNEIKNATLLNIYNVFKNGEKTKTREIYAFLYQENSNYYFYIYG